MIFDFRSTKLFQRENFDEQCIGAAACETKSLNHINISIPHLISFQLNFCKIIENDSIVEQYTFVDDEESIFFCSIMHTGCFITGEKKLLARNY